MRVKFTVLFIANVPVPQRGTTVFWDTDGPRGFGLAVTAGGRRAFIYNYRHDRVQRRLHMKPGLSLSQARKQARILQGLVATGKDPLTERRKIKAEETNTVAHVIKEYFEFEGPKLRSWHFRETMVKKHILPKFGKRQIDGIRRLEVTQRYRTRFQRTGCQQRHGVPSEDIQLARGPRRHIQVAPGQSGVPRRNGRRRLDPTG
jgi:hypothetical protein